MFFATGDIVLQLVSEREGGSLGEGAYGDGVLAILRNVVHAPVCLVAIFGEVSVVLGGVHVAVVLYHAWCSSISHDTHESNGANRCEGKDLGECNTAKNK